MVPIVTLALLWLHQRYVIPSRLPPRDSVPRPCPSERSNVRLSITLRDRPDHAGSRLPSRGIVLEVYVAKTQRADTSRVLPVALSYVASSLAESCPRIRECPTPRRVYVASRSSVFSHVAFIAPRDLGVLKLCSYLPDPRQYCM